MSVGREKSIDSGRLATCWNGVAVEPSAMAYFENLLAALAHKYETSDSHAHG